MENTQNTQDDFIINWLPNCQDMLTKTLKNINLSYYPFSGSENKYKVFDFAPQRGLADADDEFIAIDQKASAASAKQKGKIQTRTQNVAVKKHMQGSKGGQYQQTKLKVTQTIAVKPDWKVIASFNKQSLEKLRIETDVEVEDKLFCGRLYKISDDFQRDAINPLNPVVLQRYDDFKFFGNISTLEDEKLKSATDIANVFVTDKILSVIMTCVFNSRPWHLKITKIGDSIFIDKMPNSEIDLITVNESSDNMPPDDDDKNIDSFKNLAVEATLINEFIKEQVIDTEYPYDEELEVNVEPHPFAEEGEKDIERLTYRYRLWKFGDIEVMVRCQIHSFDVNEKGENNYVNVFALNEFDKNSFKSTEHQSMSQHLRKELPNNHLKLTKWGVQSYLGGVETIKIGFVSRKNTKINNTHVLSGFYDIKLNDLLSVTNFNRKVAWGIFKQIIEIIRNQQDGTFILMKTLSGPKPIVKLLRTSGSDSLEVEESEF